MRLLIRDSFGLAEPESQVGNHAGADVPQGARLASLTPRDSLPARPTSPGFSGPPSRRILLRAWKCFGAAA
jgi:hypothetical protein